MRDGDRLPSPCSQRGHGLEVGVDCPCERCQLSLVSRWPTGRANWEFCSKPSSSSALLPPGSFTSCEALPGGDLLPHASGQSCHRLAKRRAVPGKHGANKTLSTLRSRLVRASPCRHLGCPDVSWYKIATFNKLNQAFMHGTGEIWLR